VVPVDTRDGGLSNTQTRELAALIIDAAAEADRCAGYALTVAADEQGSVGAPGNQRSIDGPTFAVRRSGDARS
jgi:hypothetical protein